MSTCGDNPCEGTEHGGALRVTNTTSCDLYVQVVGGAAIYVPAHGAVCNNDLDRSVSTGVQTVQASPSSSNRICDTQTVDFGDPPPAGGKGLTVDYTPIAAGCTCT